MTKSLITFVESLVLIIMKSLFICGTPLQSLIIQEIIRKKDLDSNECTLFFYSDRNNEKFRHYYENLSKLFHRHVYFVEENNSLKSLRSARRIFQEFSYSDVYFASLVKIYSYIPLGLGKHNGIYTFDDGTANIFSNSSYSQKYGLSWKKWLIMISSFNFYYAERIRRESITHYTLYPEFRNNVSSNTERISPFISVERVDNEGSCAVILGTMFEEVFKPRRLPEIYAALKSLASRCPNKVFYIPHPRSTVIDMHGMTSLSCPRIAEEIVCSLLASFKEVHIFGFCSSAQFNLLGLDGVKNYFLETNETAKAIEQTRKLFSESGRDFLTVNLTS